MKAVNEWNSIRSFVYDHIRNNHRQKTLSIGLKNDPGVIGKVRPRVIGNV
jgi:hypothetical protein